MTMKQWLKSAVIGSFAFALAACGTGDETTGGTGENGDAGEETEEEASVTEYELTFTMDVEETDEGLKTVLTIQNETDEEKRIDFATSQKYDVIVKDEDGDALYQFSEGQMFTQALVSETVEAGGEYVMEDIWETDEDLSGRTFEVEAMLNIFSVDNEEIDKSVFTLNKTAQF
ncbi:BsuPI-related putative proteinase inhibitor [Alteribacter natronophilus]|uniref:BsuPI-related putative proteinase inhibitor n=1 Tax=Alteribacter natronophilus TaxID=2583810 RepID=UPI00110EC6B8|nr:BsuPI-related putative proteinase inhibitor [Alteribacter natronophilus]TMW71498.1 hypothetical protein FGB90_10680 [Alteribacter natronophilus]